MWSHFLNFLGLVVSVVTTPTLKGSVRKCARFIRNLAPLTLLSPEPNVVPRNRSRNRTANVTEGWNRLNSIHPQLVSLTKPCSRKRYSPVNFKILRDDHETKHMFSSTTTYFIQTRKNIGNFLTGRAIRSDKQSGTFKFALTKCKTCPHIYNMLKMLGRNRSPKITDIYYITCKPCQKIYIGKTR